MQLRNSRLVEGLVQDIPDNSLETVNLSKFGDFDFNFALIQLLMFNISCS